MKVLEANKFWTTKTETASRVRGRIESVLDWATVRKYRAGDNPARWRGHLDHLLPDKAKVTEIEHMKAMPWAEVPAFMAELRAYDSMPARALEFIVLSAARTNECAAQGRRRAFQHTNARRPHVPGNQFQGTVKGGCSLQISAFGQKWTSTPSLRMSGLGSEADSSPQVGRQASFSAERP
jgi:hypothetical protein